MTKEEFLKVATDYEDQTGFMSFQHMMRMTPGYKALMDAGRDVVVPWIIQGFENHKKKTILNLNEHSLWGMSWVLILIDITGESPIEPEPVAGGKMAAWNVSDTCNAWINWYRNDRPLVERRDPRKMTNKFLNLPHHTQLKIIKSLELVTQEEINENRSAEPIQGEANEMRLFKLAFTRARDRAQLEKLWDAIEGESEVAS
jgi:hypothetical protein